MNILIASDNNYVPPACVLIQSIFDNTDFSEIDIWYFFINLSERNQKRLRNLVEVRNKGRLHFIKVPENAFIDAPVVAHFTRETYFRFLAIELLPKSMDRILYLDPDIVVNNNLDSLYYETFFENDEEKLFVACEDKAISSDKKVYERLNIPIDRKYFNAGVMLMNLDLLRENMELSTIYKYILQKGDELKYCDQDVLNAFFYNQIKLVDSNVYNLMVCNISNTAIEKIKKAKIIHYAGSSKPWKFRYKHLGLDIYKKYVIRGNCYGWYLKQKVKSFFAYYIKKIKRTIG